MGSLLSTSLSNLLSLRFSRTVIFTGVRWQYTVPLICIFPMISHNGEPYMKKKFNKQNQSGAMVTGGGGWKSKSMFAVVSMKKSRRIMHITVTISKTVCLKLREYMCACVWGICSCVCTSWRGRNQQQMSLLTTLHLPFGEGLSPDL